jgi:microcystin-dependent protein
MATPYLGEIKLISWNFPPKGWTFCNGQLLPINQNQAVFSLFGTTYGGDGRVNFGLPNLQGRVPFSMGGNGLTLGQNGGETAHTLNISELPQHNHIMQANASVVTGPGLNVPDATKAVSEGKSAQSGTPLVTNFGTSTLAPMAASSIGNTGGSQAHNNMAPYLVVNFIVALQGIFPSQN